MIRRNKIVIANSIQYNIDTDSYRWISGSKILKQPLTLYINTTNECNLKCSYCYNRYRKANVMQYAEFKRAWKSTKNWHPIRVVLTGGEPLKSSDVPRMAKRIRENQCSITLATSGLGIERMYTEICRYIDWYDVSITTLDEKAYKNLRGANRLNEVLKACRILLENDRRVKASLMAHPILLDRLDKDIQKLLDSGYNIVKVQSYLTQKKFRYNIEKYNELIQKYKENKRVIVPNIPIRKIERDNGYLYLQGGGELVVYDGAGKTLRIVGENDIVKIAEKQVKMYRVI